MLWRVAMHWDCYMAVRLRGCGSMIDLAKLEIVLASYKKDFVSQQWEDERYKWEAIQHFQKHWDIDAADFAGMFMRATDKTYNLLASMNNFPKGMIKSFAKADAEATRAMFVNLFDESEDYVERTEKFRSDAEMLRVKYDDGTWKQHYQNLNSVSTYLWLRYPDTYYIYKYTEYCNVAKYLGSDFIPKKGISSANLIGGFHMYNEIRKKLLADDELVQMLQSVIKSDCYPDKSLNTLTMDVGFYISRIHKPKFYKAGAARMSSGTKTQGYWWLNANPRTWSFSDIGIGESQSYTLYNENGNKRRIFQNFLDARAGDFIVGYESNPVKQVVAIAKVTKENDGQKLCFEKIESLTTPIDYTTLKNCPQLEQMEYFKNAQGSLFKLSEDEYNFIMDIVREENLVAIKETNEAYSKENFLTEVYMTSERFDTLVSLLKNKQNLILQGAPGVGKTFAAKRLAYAMMEEKDDSRVEFIQFHQNYSYEDFVMGYKPSGEGFELQNGIFYRFCQKAANMPDKPFFFIIDEINRGNLSKIFGELLMLIEKDYRGTKATLAYQGMPFSVPKNLYIIGMMNTADRSLAMLDYALRRRFSFFEMEPGFDSNGFKAYQDGFAHDIFSDLVKHVKVLNREITEDSSLGKGFCIGHSYFCGRQECTDAWLAEVVKYDILPMLGEYWFDDPAKLNRWEGILRGIFHDEQ